MKKRKNSESLRENSDAVTEIVGEILMTAIAVLAFSVISIFVFSYMDSTDKPHVDVDGWVDVESDIVNLQHSGGEVVDSKDIKLILNLNGSQKEVNSNEIGSIFDKNKWQLGDVISINTSSKWNEGIKENDYIETTIVHTQSNIVIKNGVLLGGNITEKSSNEIIEPPEGGKEDAYYVEYVDGTVKLKSKGNGSSNNYDLSFEFNVTKENKTLYISNEGIEVGGQGIYSGINIVGEGNKKINGHSLPAEVNSSDNAHRVKVKIKTSSIVNTNFVYDDMVPNVDDYIIIKLIFNDNSSKIFYFKEE